MSIVHVDFRARSVVQAPLDYSIDFRNGCLAVVDSWREVHKSWDIIAAKLTLKQHRKVIGSLKYSTMLRLTLKVTKDKRLLRLATDALAMAERLEASKQTTVAQ